MPVPLHFLRLLGLTMAVMVALLLYEHMVLGSVYLPEAKPALSGYEIFRSLTALLLSVGLVRAICQDGARLGSPLMPLMPNAGIFASAAIACLAVFAAWLFSIDPQLFNALSLEDNSVEWLSALCLFVASAFFAVVAVGQLGQARSGAGPQAWLAVGAGIAFAVVFFVIGMEEISWMQRVFQVATPEVFEELNDQHEFNFHNMSTGVSELVYYTGAFTLLGLIPFGLHVFRNRIPRGPLTAFVPNLFILAAAAPMAAFNSGRWGVLPIQISTMMTVIILLVLANAALKNGLWREFLLFAGIAISVVAMQELFLVEADRLVRLWDPTEYKELFIGIGLALYAGQTWSRLRARRQGFALART